MKPAVVYLSKSGYTRQYAQWLAEALDAALYEAHAVNRNTLMQHDPILYGGGLYASGINGLKPFLQHVPQMPGKRFIVFAVGVTPARDDVALELIRHNIPPAMQSHVPLFYVRGGFDAGALTVSDRFLMGLLKLKIHSKPSLSPDERGMLAAYEHPVNFSRRENLDPIIAHVHGLSLEDYLR